MSIKLIATDLDGTFVDDEKHVPELNKRAVEVAAQHGIPFVFATGRPARWLNNLTELIADHPYAITSNGAITLDLQTNKVIALREIDPQLCLQVVADIRAQLPEAVFAVEYTTDWGAEPGFPQRNMEFSELVADIDQLIARDKIAKLLVVEPNTRTDLLAEIVSPIVGQRLTVTFSYIAAAGMLEISAYGVSKALALQELMAKLGIAPAELVAFGDMPNDLAMLELAGQGYAMAGAHQSLIDAGYPVAGDNNSGAVGRTVLELLVEN